MIIFYGLMFLMYFSIGALLRHPICMGFYKIGFTQQHPSNDPPDFKVIMALVWPIALILLLVVAFAVVIKRIFEFLGKAIP